MSLCAKLKKKKLNINQNIVCIYLYVDKYVFSYHNKILGYQNISSMQYLRITTKNAILGDAINKIVAVQHSLIKYKMHISNCL